MAHVGPARCSADRWRRRRDLAALRVGKDLTIQVDAWTPIKRRARSALSEEAERLAAYRGLTLDAVLGA